VFGTVAGFALKKTLPTPAVPTEIFNAPFVPVFAPPEVAVIVATPLLFPALNVTETRPPESVLACGGSIDPSVVVNVICVPL
jgi:hypothetical protein